MLAFLFPSLVPEENLFWDNGHSLFLHAEGHSVTRPSVKAVKKAQSIDPQQVA